MPRQRENERNRLKKVREEEMVRYSGKKGITWDEIKLRKRKREREREWEREGGVGKKRKREKDSKK